MLSAADELAGKKAKCKACGQVITVPGASTEEKRPVESEATPPPASGIKVQPAQISTQAPPAAAGVGAPGIFAYAGFWRRLVAIIIDWLVLTVVGTIIGLAFGLVLISGDVSAQLGHTIANVLGITIGWLYFALMESSVKQATLGKMALGLMVTDLNGGRISFARATGRHFAKIISALLLFLGFLMAGFTQRKQALHDMIASCLVIRQW
jgi:uncharacterized RDD family membrane protein YckC